MSLSDFEKGERKNSNNNHKRGLIISKGWLQAAILVFIFGFFVLGLLAYWSYTEKPPIPERVLNARGGVLFTGNEIIEGQQIFLKNGLMQYGSILGHGAYLGPDFTTDYLRRASDIAKEYYGGINSDRAKISTIKDFKTNRYNAATGTLIYSDAQEKAYKQLQDYYAIFFSEPTTKYGLRPQAITNREDTDKLTAYFSWTAWLAAAQRPGKDYSYTNNWPPEPAVANTQTAESITWSVLSLIALLGGIGLMLAAFGRWKFIGWHGRENVTLTFIDPQKVSLTPSQKSTAYFFFVMAALFLLQALLGGSIQHYRTELTNFFGFDLAKVLPFNVARTWHLQLAIFWVATSFLAAGIFLAPLISQTEPNKQHWLAYGLLGALAIVVFGSLIGEYLGIFGFMGKLWNWFGNQGWEYIDLGRFWQILLSIGLLFWVIIIYRSIRSRLKNEHMANMPWIFFFAALAIPAFYAVGLLATTDSNYTVADYWRWWVVHLWVEDFLELFTTVVVAYIFVLLGIVQEKTALTLIFLDFILYSAGGVIGTMHHMYFSGAPVQHMALGAVFSAAEVVPLTFLTVEAWSFLQLGTAQISKTATPFPHKWAVMFLVSVGFWNFVGAGIFGFLINLPIVSYYEIGTGLTANHGHAAFMGVYGMLAVGLALFCLRYLIPTDKWSDKLAKFSFWTLNIGLAWMCLGTLLPLGVIQLYHSVNTGYFEARSLKFLTTELNTIIEWIRFPGDMLVIIGIIPLIIMTWRGIRYRVERISEKPQEIILTEISEDVK